jgi:xanthine dehydrogenase molybdenum-binding subunit
MSTITLHINGLPHRVEIQPDATILSVLRGQLGLTGPKNGCGEGHCGACTVIVDGRAVRSCVYPAARAAGKKVETIEGLSAKGELHPLQRAFIESGAVQCGFCTPGMIMAAKALLDANPHPSDAEIRRALRHNLCRCTGYASIVRAIRAAESGLPPKKIARSRTPSALVQVGQPLPRPDAEDKVTGHALYAADLRFPRMVYARVLRSRYAHAQLLKVDVAAAKLLPGVLAVLTAADAPGAPNHGLERADWPVLCDDRVRYIGDAIAVVVAETDEIAAQALDLIQVEYDPLPVIETPEQALAEGAPLIHPSGNLLKHIEVERGDVERGFAESDIVIERTYHTARAEHAFLEPEASVALVDEAGILNVYVGSQIPFEDRRQIAASLGLPEEQVRVIHTETGGAFGGKEDIAGQIHAALAAWVTRRPVKLVYARRESFISHPKRHPVSIRLTTGAAKDGKLLALEAHIVGDTGAYASLGAYVMTRTATHAAGPYSVANVRITCDAVYTNNVPSGAFRGFGVPQSAFAIETQMDLLAEALGGNALAIRARNAFEVGSVTATGQRLRESVGLIDTLARVAKELEKLARPVFEPIVEGRKRRAWGLACAYKNVGLGGGAPDSAGARVEIRPDGRVHVRAGAAEVGQGLVGVLAQIAAEELGASLKQVEVLVGDTAQTLDGGATTASRQTTISGNAARLAAAAVRAQLNIAAARLLQTTPGRIVIKNGYACATERPVRRITWRKLVQAALADGQSLAAERVYTPPPTAPLGQAGDMHFAFGYTTQAAEVEVDLDTGEVKVLRVIAAHDVGRAINPLAVQGQIEGGVVMGLGLALKEELPAVGGIPAASDFAHYHIPTVEDAPEITPIIVEEPFSAGPYGAKGVGEITSIPTAPAILNAIYNACGARLYEIPATPERVLAALMIRASFGEPNCSV